MPPSPIPGQTLLEVRKLLQEDEIDPRAAMRATLAIVADLYEVIWERKLEEDQRHALINTDLDVLKKMNILLWIKQNKPVATTLGVLLFLVAVFLQDVVRPILAKALGL